MPFDLRFHTAMSFAFRFPTCDFFRGGQRSKSKRHLVRRTGERSRVWRRPRARSPPGKPPAASPTPIPASPASSLPSGPGEEKEIREYCSGWKVQRCAGRRLGAFGARVSGRVFSPRGVIRLTICCVRGRDNQKSLANSQMLAGFNHKMSKHDMAVQGMRTTDYADMTDEAGED